MKITNKSKDAIMLFAKGVSFVRMSPNEWCRFVPVNPIRADGPCEIDVYDTPAPADAVGQAMKELELSLGFADVQRHQASELGLSGAVEAWSGYIRGMQEAQNCIKKALYAAQQAPVEARGEVSAPQEAPTGQEPPQNAREGKPCNCDFDTYGAHRPGCPSTTV